MTIAKNSLANLIRLGVSVLAAAVLPPFLTRRLSHDMYAAWVLILQMSAYAAIFELGPQSAISKFVAQHQATDDHPGTSSVVSTAMVLLGISAALAMIAVVILVWQVPRFFPQLTPTLIHEVRLGIFLVGGATALALPTTALASSFQGVQRNSIPMAIQAASQTLSVIVIVLAVLLHGNLIAMGACVAAVTLFAGLVQVVAWQKYLAHIRVALTFVTRQTARIIFAYCASMSVWSFAMLLISGLDTTVVGHFDSKHRLLRGGSIPDELRYLDGRRSFQSSLTGRFRVGRAWRPRRYCLLDAAVHTLLRSAAGGDRLAAIAVRLTDSFNLGGGRLCPPRIVFL